MRRFTLFVAFVLVTACQGDGPTGIKPIDTTKVPPVNTITFSGKINLLKPRSSDSPAGWSVIYSIGSKDFTTVSNTDGSYRIDVPDTALKSSDVKILLRPAQGSRYGQMYFETTVQAAKSFLPWNAIGNTWTIEHGPHAGQTVSIDVEQLIAASQADASKANFVPVYRFEAKNPSPFPGEYSFTSWDEFPIGACLDRSTAQFSASDSVFFWNALNEIEVETGTDYYKPAECSTMRRGIKLQFLPNIADGGIGEQPSKLMDPRLSTSDYTVVLGLSRMEFLSPNSNFDGKAMIKHEAIHNLGFGHICGRASVMNTGYPGCNDSKKVTAEDVAALEMIQALRKLELSNRTFLGLAETVWGKRWAPGFQPVYANPLS